MQSIIRIIFTAILVTWLTACGSGGSSDNSTDIPAGQDNIYQTSDDNLASVTDTTNSSISDTNTQSQTTDTSSTNDTTPFSTTAVLSWEEPTQRENGDTLPSEEIYQYEILYTDPDGEIHNVSVTPQQRSLEITMTTGVYEFAITTIDIYGLTSDLSETITCNIDRSNSSCI